MIVCTSDDLDSDNSLLFSDQSQETKGVSKTPNSSPKKQRHENRRWSTPPSELRIPFPPKYENHDVLTYAENDVDLSNVYVFPIMSDQAERQNLFSGGTLVDPIMVSRMEHRYQGHPFVSVRTNQGFRTLSLCEVMSKLGISY